MGRVEGLRKESGVSKRQAIPKTRQPKGQKQHWGSWGICTFLETEEGLLEAWERKILIFPQENELFLWIVANELGGQGGKTLSFLQEIVHVWKQKRVCWKPESAKY